MKPSFDRDQKSQVVFEISCNWCESIYVGQASRDVTTNISKHQQNDSQLRQHLVECSGSANESERKILYTCRTVQKLMAIEAIYMGKFGQGLITHDEYKGSSNYNFDLGKIQGKFKI